MIVNSVGIAVQRRSEGVAAHRGAVLRAILGNLYGWFGGKDARIRCSLSVFIRRRPFIRAEMRRSLGQSKYPNERRVSALMNGLPLMNTESPLMKGFIRGKVIGL